jgi:hypothetical protein
MTWRQPVLFIDCVHYIAQAFWVLANAIWSVEELYHMDSDTAHYVFDFGPKARSVGRWWASWCILAAFMPILYLYLVWLPMVLRGRWTSSRRFELVSRRDAGDGPLSSLELSLLPDCAPYDAEVASSVSPVAHLASPEDRTYTPLEFPDQAPASTLPPGPPQPPEVQALSASRSG